MAATSWQIGDHLRVRGRHWTLQDLTAWSGCTELRLSSSARPLHTLVAPFDRPVSTTRPWTTSVVYPRQALHVLRRLNADAAPFGGAIAASRAAVHLLPHQLEPLLAMVRHGITRVLVADAVGLGKTIQAGLILQELAGREAGCRGLILVPAGLRAQWRQELSDRFQLEVEEADAEWLRRAAADRPADVNPWSLPGIYLTSIDFAKRPEVLRALEDTSWDLVIVDEAHTATGGSDRRQAAHALACRARRVLLLTATPDTGDPAAFAALCDIGRLDAQDASMVMFRRAREDVGRSLPRRSVIIRVPSSPAEQRMHDLLDGYTRRVWREASKRGDAAAKLATIVLRKRALSSATSLAMSAARRHELLGGLAVAAEHQLLLPLADEDALADAVEDDELAAPGLANVRLERRWLSSIVEAARAGAGAESKARRLLRMLARIREPVIVFTEYRDTLARLEQLVRATGRHVETMHGGMERRERDRVQRAFNRGGTVLLATDAASEGLNLHHTCRIVVHYELPWRPARIEQRVGRIDRLGQARRVHEIALVAAGTVERLVLAPLLARAAQARIAGGPAAGLLDSLSEAAVSELVMGGSLPEPPARSAVAVMARHMDLRGEAATDVSRLEDRRTCLARSPPLRHAPNRAAVVSRLGARRSGPGVVSVFVVSLVDADGRSVHRENVAVHLEGDAAPAAGRRAADLRAAAEAVRRWSREPGHALAVYLSRLATDTEARIEGMRRAAELELGARDESMRRAQPSAARQMVQTGLFDRRALAAHSRASAARGALLEGVAARQHERDRRSALRVDVDLAVVLLRRARR